MSLFDLFRSSRPWFKASRQAVNVSPHVNGENPAVAPATQDTLAAIGELSLVVKNNPDLVEIYLALGNLYRSQGEIERAVQIRNSLIVRPGLDPRFKARALYELGRDYKRGGFLDRSIQAFNEARKLGGDEEAIVRELATLAAESGEFERAAGLHAQLKQPVPQAHYLVRIGQKHFAAGDPKASAAWVAKALKVHPGSVEVWLAKLSQALYNQHEKKLQSFLRTALSVVAPELRFMLFDGLLYPSRAVQTVASPPTVLGADETTRAAARNILCDALIPIVEESPPDILLVYYAALLLMACRDADRTMAWLDRTLVLEPDFWAGRLEILSLGLAQQDFSPVFKGQLEFFIGQARQLKRFICRSCGLKQEHIFFICPRCKSWHSIAFRTVLHD